MTLAESRPLVAGVKPEKAVVENLLAINVKFLSNKT